MEREIPRPSSGRLSPLATGTELRGAAVVRSSFPSMFVSWWPSSASFLCYFRRRIDLQVEFDVTSKRTFVEHHCRYSRNGLRLAHG